MSEQKRDALIAGLRQLADWLEAHPDVPGPLFPDFVYGTSAKDDDAGRAEVERLAALLGVEVDRRDDGSATADRMFAGLKFHVYYNAREAMRRHAASSTYSGAVEPDGSPS